MPTIIATDREGRTHRIEGEVGDSVMEVLKFKGQLDVLADCGGSAMCGTCHVYVDTAWIDKLPPIAEEEDMLLNELLERRPNSRLSCQNRLTEALDGVKVTLAEVE